jgi:hypothetical protein
MITHSAFIEIRTRFIQIYSATLHVHAHFTGIRYVMFYYPMLSAFCGVSGNLFFLVLVAAFSWHHWFLGPFQNQQSVVKVDFGDEGVANGEYYRQHSGSGMENGSRRTSASLEARRAELREKLGQRRKFHSYFPTLHRLERLEPIYIRREGKTR